MTAIDTICSDLKSIDGTVGAFVWHQNRCVASSLPNNYDAVRVGQIGGGLWRLMLLAHTAGYEGSPSVLHWQRASLYAWGAGADGMLAVLTVPSVPRTLLELGAAIAADNMARLLEGGRGVHGGSGKTLVDAGRHQGQGGLGTTAKLVRADAVLAAEVGPLGRSLLERSVRQAWHPGVPESVWLPRVRALVLAEIDDEAARTRVGATSYWD